MAVLNSKT